MSGNSGQAIRKVSLMQGDATLTVFGDYVMLKNTRPARDVAEAEAVIRSVDLELTRAAKTGEPRLIIDTSESQGVSSDAVRDRMSAWLKSKEELGRIGWIVEKDMHQIAVNMSSVSKGARIRAFLTVQDALKWMRSG